MFRNVFVKEHKLMSVSLPMKVEGLHNPSERRAGKPKWRLVLEPDRLGLAEPALSLCAQQGSGLRSGWVASSSL